MNEIFFMMIYLPLKLLMKVSDSASNTKLFFGGLAIIMITYI